jgi:hypothetical protein
MGQASNIVTLRVKNNSLNLNSFINKKEFIFYYTILNKLNRIFAKKGIVILDSNLNTFGNNFFIQFDIYYRTQKYLKYKFKTKKLNLKKVSNFTKNKINLSPFFEKLFSKKNNNIIKVVNYNKKLSKEKLNKLYPKFKQFIFSMFSRRFNLFFDFLKLTSLLVDFSICTKQYLNLIVQIFHGIAKQSHSKFLFFIKYLFIEILDLTKKNSQILGIKLVLSGKIKGKTRASVSKVLIGSVPNNTISANIQFFKSHCCTLYGVYGFKLWINRKIN